jgi:hypothetical protein
MKTPPIPQLLFSTRAEKPESGTEFNRQVVAASPGLPEAALSMFASHADLTFTIDQQRELQPVLSMTRLGANSWLLCRAKSLGVYRKSSHHMLVHGLVLHRDHLELLQGNPFLLEDPVVSAAGFKFREKHPGSERELPHLTLDESLGPKAPELNRQRLERLSRELEGELGAAFPELFDKITGSDHPIALVREAPPDRRWVEWGLLHFHPDDRLELSFHTWYGFNRRHDYRLLMVPQGDLARLRPRFQDLVLWRPEAPSAQATSQLARWTLELRQRSPGSFLATLERYRITHLATQPTHAIVPEDAQLCLWQALGGVPDEVQQERLKELKRRGGNLLVWHLYELAEFWIRGGDALQAELTRKVEAGDWEIEPRLLAGALSYLESGDWLARWSLLALLLCDLRTDSRHWPEYLVPFWDEMAPSEGAGDFLRRFASSVEDAVRIEMLVDEAVRQGMPPEVASAWYQRLAELAFEADFPQFAYRLRFQKWAPLAGEGEHRERLAGIVEQLLADSGEHDDALRTPLSDTGTAPEMWEILGEWLQNHPNADMGWGRWQQLMEHLEGTLPLETAADCGRFLARLTLSDRAERTLEACRMLLRCREPEIPAVDFRVPLFGTALLEVARLTAATLEPAVASRLNSCSLALIQTRLGFGPEAEGLEEVDQYLMAFLFEIRVRAEEILGQVEEGKLAAEFLDDGTTEANLQRALGDLLRFYQLQERLGQVVSAESPWGRFLFDELLRYPPDPGQDLTSEARFVACIELAWRRWNRQDPAAGRMLWRLCRWSERVEAGAGAWQREQIERLVHPYQQDAARRVLELPPDSAAARS